MLARTKSSVVCPYRDNLLLVFLALISTSHSFHLSSEESVESESSNRIDALSSSSPNAPAEDKHFNRQSVMLNEIGSGSNILGNVQFAFPNLKKWVNGGFGYVEDFDSCTSSNVGGEDECLKLGRLRRSQFSVYMAYSRFENGSIGKVYAILPDSTSMKAGGEHDAVMVLDPYPNAPFGHILALFYLDFHADPLQCSQEEFQTLTSDGTCISVGRKPRCPNRLEKFTPSYSAKPCHIDFLPTVYSRERVDLSPVLVSQGRVDFSLPQFQNLLTCVPLQGFSPCPRLRSFEDTSSVFCDMANSRRCDTSKATVGRSCKLFQTCDRAVLIGGGWNRLHSPASSLQNIQVMEASLKSLGFHGDNIKVFYANGRPFERSLRHKKGEVFPSALKTALRGHIRTVCSTSHCADTFLLYLNNPSTGLEGDMLLWDVDSDGMLGEGEVYTVREFVSDISACGVKRVVLVVDQAATEVLMTALKGLGNVFVYNNAGGEKEFTQRWANVSSPTICMRDLHQALGSGTFYDPSQDNVGRKLSIVGAPCDLHPPVSSGELKSQYQGCQNVPTSVWFSEELGSDFGGETTNPMSGGLIIDPKNGGDTITSNRNYQTSVALLPPKKSRRAWMMDLDGERR